MNNYNPIISIIIPIYNLEDYISKALDSIYNQKTDCELFEVIAVNDGSTDKSVDILEKYSLKFSNLHVFSNKNHGVSFSRNFAIEQAKGKYITFLDGDDEFLPDSIQQIIDKVNSNPSDVLYVQTFIDKGIVLPCHVTPPHVVLDKIYNIDQLGDFCNGFGSVCGGIYDINFINRHNLRFAEGIANGEDTIFNYLLYTKNPRIVFANISLYKVSVRNESASRNITIEKAKKCVLNIRYLSRIINENNYNLQEAELIHKAFWNSIGNAVDMFIKCGIYDSTFIWNSLELDLVPKLRIRNASFSTRIKVFILNYSFRLYIKLLKLKKYEESIK